MLTTVLSFLSVLAAQEPAPTAVLPLSAANYERIRDAIVPAASELEWLEVGWRPVLGAAVAEAREADKPLFLWAMNGHPLGCT